MLTRGLAQAMWAGRTHVCSVCTSSRRRANEFTLRQPCRGCALQDARKCKSSDAGDACQPQMRLVSYCWCWLSTHDMLLGDALRGSAKVALYDSVSCVGQLPLGRVLHWIAAT